MTKKNYCHITLEQRYKIDALLKAGHKAPFISGQLNVDRSTIYRELGRNRTKTGCYSSCSAHEIAEEKKERFSYNRKFSPAMERFIRDKLSNEQWSTEQIAGYCKKHVIPMVSHEHIYQFIYQDKAEDGQLYKHLRVASKMYRKRYGSGKNKRIIIKDRVSIDQRAEFYFAHPYSSWERGLNEYTNRLIRQYIPKKTDFKDVNDQQIKNITMKLNSRPRKKLNFKSPGIVFFNSFNPKVAFAS